MNRSVGDFPASRGGSATLELRSSPGRLASDHKSRLSRWGGLLAALASTDDFDTVCNTDEDLKEMITTVSVLEESLQDCAFHGPQQVIDAFISCQLTPAILNRWNSPVLDALWQAITGRTPDGVTPFAVNAPASAAELLNRMVWPKSYAEAAELFVEMNLIALEGSTTAVLAPAIITLACKRNHSILQRLLVAPLSEEAKDYVCKALPHVIRYSDIRSMALILSFVTPFQSVVPAAHPIAVALYSSVSKDNVKLRFLLSSYDFHDEVIRRAAHGAGGHCHAWLRSAAVDNFSVLMDMVEARASRHPDLQERLAIVEAGAKYHRVDTVERAIALLPDVDHRACFLAVRKALVSQATQPGVGLLLRTFVPRLAMPDVLKAFRISFSSWSAVFSPSIVQLIWEHVPDHHKRTEQVQQFLNEGLVYAVSRLKLDLITWFLASGAVVTALNYYVIYLAALSGHAHVMELLLGVADPNAEWVVQVRQQMTEPAGLLTIARQLHETHSAEWANALEDEDDAFSFDMGYELMSALNGGARAALEWIITSHPQQDSDEGTVLTPLAEAMGASSITLIRIVATAPYFGTVLSEFFWIDVLRFARETKNFQICPHLLQLSCDILDEPLGLFHLEHALEINDPFTCRYLLGYFQIHPPIQPDWQSDCLQCLMFASMGGHVSLLEETWNFFAAIMPHTHSAFLEMIEHRIIPALQLCTEGDLTPVLMVLHELSVHSGYDTEAMELAASCGHLPAVRLFLARGIPAQYALAAAVTNGQREVVDCLIAHGAVHSELS